MAIKIHHGPNGSYKTSGAIQDDLIPAIKKGRVIITNVRGLTRERIFQVMPETPSSCDVINLDLEDLDDMEKMRTWFMWAPRGAFIIFDETQLIFLKSWREADLKRFDFPDGPEAAKAAGRPMGWLDAWTRHRHFNWDIILTTPNIAYIRDDIRMTAEKAYLHSNLAVIGIRGRYKESQHSAQDNKPPARDVIVEIKKIRKETFALYESTATGSVTDTIAGKSLFRQPKILLFMAIPALAIGSVVYDGGPRLLMGDPVSPPAAGTAAPAQAGPAVGAARAVGAAGPDAADDVPRHPGVPGAAPVGHPFAGRDFIVKATLLSASGRRTYLFAVRGQDGSEFTLTDRDLTDTGYAVVPRGNCAAELSFKGGWSGYAACAGRSALGNAPPAQAAAPNVPPAAANSAAVRVTVVPDTSRLPRSIN
ncbi:TPA: hypothetical protein SL801_001818 [Pseudomonas aeruginosa]|nr:hypothetical protein [Pseudomonas aeruginosa]HEJ5962778.1 hypothetical protein [Pseudomonas aeruginosa]